VRSVDDPEVWRWIWLGGAVFFGLAELASAGAFFMLPFAVGAAVAALLAFLAVPLGFQLLAFGVVSIALLAGLRPLAEKLARDHPAEGIGAKRLIGQQGTILGEVPAGLHELGLVRIHREEWRAESVDGTAIAQGTEVRVVEVRGTRVVVSPASLSAPDAPTADAPAAPSPPATPEPSEPSEPDTTDQEPS
jgi:membrane protein implicated in regulation of membrane protease activity